MAQEQRPGMGLLKAALAIAMAGSTWIKGVTAVNILQTSGFNNCGNNTAVQVQKVDIEYNNDNKTVSFNVAGTSSKVQNVTAILNVTAYGAQVYSNTFNPCAQSTFVQQLCPVPAGSFAAQGSQAIPAQYANLVPSIAFQVPDIAAQATLQLKATDGGEDVACIQSEVSNGKTTNVPAVSFVAAGVAGAAMVLAGVSAVGAAVASGSAAAAGAGGSAVGGMGTLSPSFVEVFGVFQGMAMNGMLSVNYPQVYRNFAKNFAFSTGLIPWNQMQVAIDNFRAATGGNLTGDSVQFLQNATLVFPDGSIETPSSSSSSVLRARSGLSDPFTSYTDQIRRAFDEIVAGALANVKRNKSIFSRHSQLLLRDIETSINGTGTASTDNTTGSSGAADTVRVAVSGFKAYAEELSIPSANTFMTVLLIVAIVIAAITVGILLVKVVLEAWALIGRFPESLAGFRKHYWRSIARAITTLILLLYGVWVLYCMFQFTQGDSWAAKVLAGVTLGLFTGILAFFSFKIWYTAQKLKDEEGDTSGLYDDKSIWVKYSLFYESYRKQYWWIFVPTIVYMFAKGVAIAVGDGHGMAQTIAQLAIEACMLVLLLWSRPYERRSGNIINIVIQVVRVLSVVCILVFVEEFGIAETTQTVAGVVLIAVQSALSGILAILIAWNAIVACCKENPHRKRRKELEKLRDGDNLTPLDARNSLLQRGRAKMTDEEVFSFSSTTPAAADVGTSPAAAAAVGDLKQQPTALPEMSMMSTPMDTSKLMPAATAAAPPSSLTVPRLHPSRQAPSVSSTLSASSGAVLIGLATTAPDARSLTAANNAVASKGSRPGGGDQSSDSLLQNGAPMGQADYYPATRQPTLPNLGYSNPTAGAAPLNRGPPPSYTGPYRPNNNYNNYNNNNGNYSYQRSNGYSPFPTQAYNAGGNGNGRYVPYNANNNGNYGAGYGNNYNNFNGPYPGPYRGPPRRY